jgi:hypothetical protein
MCRAVAPRDLAAVPVYIVFASEAPELAAAVRGWTHTAAADAFRPNIADWRGPGVAMLLNDVLIGQELDALLPGLPDKRREAYIEANLRDTALHELTHILVDGVAYRPLSCPPEVFTAAIARWAAENEQLWQQGQMRDTDYDDHGAQFTRIALHIAYRAQRLGFAVLPGSLCAGYKYGMYDAERYAMALIGEPAKLASESFADIARRPMPKSLLATWRRDMERRKAQQNSNPSGHVARRENTPVRSDIMSLSVLDKIAERFKTRKRKQATGYNDGVRRVATGEDVDPGKIAELLDDSGKTFEQFETDVKLYQRRATLVDLINSAPALRAEEAKIRQDMAAADEKLRLADGEHTATVIPLAARLDEIAETRRRAEEAKHELRKTCARPKLMTEARQIQAELDQMAPQISRLAQVRIENREAVSSGPDAYDTHGSDFRKREMLDTLQRRAKVAERAETELNELQTRRDALLARLDEIVATTQEVWPD